MLPKDEDKNSFGCPLWAEQDLSKILSWMTEDTYIYEKNGIVSYDETPMSNRYKFPRFGVYSEILKNVSVFIYDDNILNERFGDTACTDGSNIFINLNFYKSLYLEEIKNENEGRLGIIPIILHEVAHIVENDVNKITPENSAKMINIASDIFNNATLKRNFPFVKWLPSLMIEGFGLKAGDEHYAEKNIEQVIADIEHKIETGKSPSLSLLEEKRIHSEALYLPEEKGRSISSITKALIFNIDSEHFIKKEKTVDVLNEAGLSHINEMLGLTNSDGDMILHSNDKDMESVLKNSVEEIEKFVKHMNVDLSDLPSGDIAGNIKKQIRLKRESGVLTWDQVMVNDIFSGGDISEYNDDIPSDIFYVDEVSEMIGFELFEGRYEQRSSDQSMLVLLDVSQSMNLDKLETSIREIINIRINAENNIKAKKIILMFIDVNADQQSTIILDDNVEDILEKVNVKRGGGTNLANSIISAINSPDLTHENVTSLIVFSDLDDKSIDKNFILPEEIKSVNFIGMNENKNKISLFSKKVAHFANVIDFDATPKDVLIMETRKEKSSTLKMR